MCSNPAMSLKRVGYWGGVAPGLAANPSRLIVPFSLATLTAGSPVVPVPTPSSFRAPPAHQRGPWVDLGAQEASGQVHPLGETGMDLLRGGKEEEPGVREIPPGPSPLPSEGAVFPEREPGRAARGMGELPRDGVSRWGGQQLFLRGLEKGLKWPWWWWGVYMEGYLCLDRFFSLLSFPVV